MWKKVLSALGFIALLVVMAIGGGIGKIVGKSASDSAFRSPGPTPQQIEEKLIEGFNKAAEQSNRLGPKMVDKDTRWDTTAVGPGARVTYYYSFPHYSSQDITAAWLETNLKSVVKNGVCTSKDMKPSLQYGGTYVYVYRGNDGAEITRFTFSQHDCNLPSQSQQTTPAPLRQPSNPTVSSPLPPCREGETRIAGESQCRPWSDFTPVKPEPPQPSAPSAQEVHMQKIYAAHPDANEIYRSTEFGRWLIRTPKFKHVPTDGTTQEVIDMFSAFKRRSKVENQRLDQEIDRRNEAAAEALSRQYAPAYPR